MLMLDSRLTVPHCLYPSSFISIKILVGRRMTDRIAPVPIKGLLDTWPHRFDHAADHPGKDEVRHVHHVLDAVPVDEVCQFLLKLLHCSSPLFTERPTRCSRLSRFARNLSFVVGGIKLSYHPFHLASNMVQPGRRLVTHLILLFITMVTNLR
jgi:hypothetical protein